MEPGYRAPWNQFNSLATEFFRKLAEHEKQRQIPQRLADQRNRWQPLLKALGYEITPQIQMLDDDTPLPVLARYNSTDGSPWLWIVEAHDQEEGTLDPLALSLLTAQFPADTDKHKRDSLRKKANGEYRSWQDLLSTAVFTKMNRRVLCCCSVTVSSCCWTVLSGRKTVCCVLILKRF